MKRPLRYRTMGAVREGRGNPSPYSIEKYKNYSSTSTSTGFIAGVLSK